MKYARPLSERFVVTATGCKEFTGYRNEQGYGIVRRHDRKYLAHRWAWIETHGPIPDGLCVCHRCDNPPCINIDHLFLGTPLDNIADRHAKGRSGAPKGVDAPNARFTVEQVRDIRDRYARGIANQYELAAEFGCGQTAISALIRRQTYRSVA